MSAAHTVLTI